MEFYIGTIMPFPYGFAPVGWMPCRGQLVSVRAFGPLFHLIGTTYGGDGLTTFALPDLQGADVVARAAGGFGAGPGLSPRSLGEMAGAAQHTLTEAETPPHGHAFTLYRNAPSPVATPAAGGTLLDPQTNGFQPPGTLPAVTMNVGTILPAGGGEAHPNDQPWLALVHCICYEGTFPTFTA